MMKLAMTLSLLVVLRGCTADLGPHWEVQRDAVASASHPFAGFWKSDLSDNFGMAIGPAGAGRYYVSFCGPGGCFDKGDYRPNTSLTGDPEYRIVDMDNLEIHGSNGWTKYYRSQGREVTESNQAVEPTRALSGSTGSP
ncbi:MAG TPA: hypothetical protein VE961_27360 [Pyrinomonadaceae bacterium]|nr:hypothetical protein [Pyrinomonadaceae bacterium]